MGTLGSLVFHRVLLRRGFNAVSLIKIGTLKFGSDSVDFYCEIAGIRFQALEGCVDDFNVHSILVLTLPCRLKLSLEAVPGQRSAKQVY